MSSLYIEASKIIQQFWNKRASLKTLVYGSHSDKKVNEWRSFYVIGIFVCVMFKNITSTTPTSEYYRELRCSGQGNRSEQIFALCNAL